jgi:hypothetical protein
VKLKQEFLGKIKDALLKAYNRSHAFHIRQRIKRDHRHFIKTYGEIKRCDPGDYIKYWNRLSRSVDPTGYQIHYTLHGIEDIQIVPIELYYTVIEPCLNDYTMAIAYKDKNNFERLFDRDLFPTAYLRNMAGIYYDRDYRILSDQQVRDILKALPKSAEKVMLKPSLASGFRRNVRLIDHDREELTLEYLNENYRRNFLIQEVIEQHEYFDQLGTTNNIRIDTYRSISDNSIFFYGARGGFNSETGSDRSRYGTDQVAIDGSGKLGSFSLNDLGQVSTTVPNSTVPFSAMKPIPNFDKVKKAAAEIALLCPYHRQLGMDMIVDKTGKVTIYEVNFGFLGIYKPQYLGGGLFKEHTEEVIEYCSRNKSKIRFLPFTN